MPSIKNLSAFLVIGVGTSPGLPLDFALVERKVLRVPKAEDLSNFINQRVNDAEEAQRQKEQQMRILKKFSRNRERFLVEESHAVNLFGSSHAVDAHATKFNESMGTAHQPVRIDNSDTVETSAEVVVSPKPKLHTEDCWKSGATKPNKYDGAMEDECGEGEPNTAT